MYIHDMLFHAGRESVENVSRGQYSPCVLICKGKVDQFTYWLSPGTGVEIALKPSRHKPQTNGMCLLIFNCISKVISSPAIQQCMDTMYTYRVLIP